MTREEIENLWKDPHNTKWGIYYCKEDPRVIVPKRIKWMGWTINFAHPFALHALGFIFAVLLVSGLIVASSGAGQREVLATFALSSAIVLWISIWLASRTE